MTSNLRSLHWWALTELQRALLLDAEDNGGSLTFGQAGEQLRGSIRQLTELGLVTSTATGNSVTVLLNPGPDQSEVDNDAIEAAQPAGNPVDVYSPDQPGIVLFSGWLTGAGTYGGWSRVYPEKPYIDLPPGYKVERTDI